MTRTPARPFRSREWFAAPGRSDMAALYLERGWRGILTLPAAADREVAARAVGVLPSLVRPLGPLRELRIERIDRAPVAESALEQLLRDAGFRPGYRGYLLRGS